MQSETALQSLWSKFKYPWQALATSFTTTVWNADGFNFRLAFIGIVISLCRSIRDPDSRLDPAHKLTYLWCVFGFWVFLYLNDFANLLCQREPGSKRSKLTAAYKIKIQGLSFQLPHIDFLTTFVCFWVVIFYACFLKPH